MQIGQQVFTQVRKDFIGVAHFLIQIARHRNVQLAIGVAEPVDALPGLECHHFAQWHGIAIGERYGKVLQRFGFCALVIRQGNPNFDFIIANMKNLGQRAIESGAKLVADRGGVEPQASACGGELIDQLFFTPGKIIVDIVGALIGAQGVLQLGAGAF